MKKYFYSKNKEQIGPVTLEKLKHADIKPDTLVWHEGLSHWEHAEDLEDLKEIFELMPPPLEAAVPSLSEETKKSFHESHSKFERKKQKMFSTGFTSKGRIGRSEYAITLLLYYLVLFLVGSFVISLGIDPDTGIPLFIYLGLMSVPLIFLVFQGAKRCHDRGNSGWYQVIPFYVIRMLTADGEPGLNKYGSNPKGL